MLPDSMGWDINMIKELMIETYALLVEKIPLSRISKQDRLIWRESITGVFSVKSAYYEARRVLGRENIDRDLANGLEAKMVQK